MSTPILPLIETYIEGVAPYARPGDILLVAAEPFQKSASVNVQRLLRLTRDVRHSHVAIALNDCNAIHSLPGKGVHVVPIRELAPESMIRCGRVSIYRHTALARDAKKSIELQDALWKHFNQPYFHIFKRVGNRSSYCSELAAKAYAAVDIRIAGQSPRRTLPLDIERAVQGDEWSDVSVEYLLPIIEPDISQLIGRQATTSAHMRSLLVNMHRHQDEMHAMLVRAEESMTKLRNETKKRQRLRQIKGMLGILKRKDP